MASIFTFQEQPPRVHSPWSAPACATPQRIGHPAHWQHTSEGVQVTSITKLEPERQDGPTEYKLHLLLRSRRQHSAIAATTSLDAQQSEHLTPGTRTNAHQLISTRQMRLQQLTTQLLWRLQQSSPFHSSSNADLVLPMLPEATPRLGVPEQPAKLLPGLEESQGALYEIGVADDGTLVGLIEEELEESLSNLRAMAMSLGCVVDVLRRVLVAQYGENNDEHANGGNTGQAKVWVAEVLVRPDTKSPRIPPLEEIDVTRTLSEPMHEEQIASKAVKPATEQLRVAVVGASTAGKSSLVGTLTTSTLDNGRGKSRLSLLKHRHEIASGVTSSVAQELLGYCKSDGHLDAIVNYASGNVSSWPDIHNLANRLVFLSDSPGLPRFAKSTFRSLISWKPDWTLMCIAADEDAIGSDFATEQAIHPEPVGNRPSEIGGTDLPLAYLEICLRLNLPLMVVITKMDIATKSGLKTTLSRVLSILKNAGRLPTLLGTPSIGIASQDEATDIASDLVRLSEKEEAEVASVTQKLQSDVDRVAVPIILTSSVSGTGIGKLHALLSEISFGSPVQTPNSQSLQASETVFHIDEIFAIPPSKVYSANRDDQSADRGLVLCGHLAVGRLVIGDTLRIGPFVPDSETNTLDDGPSMPRSTSYSTDNSRRPLTRAASGLLSKSLQHESLKISSHSIDPGGTFLDVYVVSLRSLRLPVRSMEAGETGTVGVQPVSHSPPVRLSRARKGMILTSTVTDSLYGYRSLTVCFSALDLFEITSPPLALGGNVIIYVNSVRAAAKITALVFDDKRDSNRADSLSPIDVFDFDDGEGHSGDEVDDAAGREVQITFRFISSIEWVEVGNRVLVIPTVAATGPVIGSSAVYTGLSGYVGKVCEVYT